MKNDLLDEPTAGQLVAIGDIHFERDLDFLVHLNSYALTLQCNQQGMYLPSFKELIPRGCPAQSNKIFFLVAQSTNQQLYLQLNYPGLPCLLLPFLVL
jgi:hypothetical protein